MRVAKEVAMGIRSTSFGKRAHVGAQYTRDRVPFSFGRGMRLALRRRPPNHPPPIRALPLTMSSSVTTRMQDLSVSLFLSRSLLLRQKSSSTTKGPP